MNSLARSRGRAGVRGDKLGQKRGLEGALGNWCPFPLGQSVFGRRQVLAPHNPVSVLTKVLSLSADIIQPNCPNLQKC